MQQALAAITGFCSNPRLSTAQRQQLLTLISKGAVTLKSQNQMQASKNKAQAAFNRFKISFSVRITQLLASRKEVAQKKISTKSGQHQILGIGRNLNSHVKEVRTARLTSTVFGNVNDDSRKKSQDLQEYGLIKITRFEERMRVKTEEQIKKKTKIAKKEKFKSEERRRDTGEKVEASP